MPFLSVQHEGEMLWDGWIWPSSTAAKSNYDSFEK
jgi:hypothetical protein